MTAASPLRVVVGGCAASINKTIQPPWRAKGKQANRPAGEGNAPLLPPAAAPLHGKASHEIFSRLMAPYKFRSLATPEGEVLAALSLRDKWHIS